jgi:hypothetical protein
MTYFEDLSDYSYFARYHQSEGKNVGWLDPTHEFQTEIPSEDVLNILWSFCSVSVAQTRGIHQCAFCNPPWRIVYALRNGARLMLGSTEIRVFSSRSHIYAAPNMIYHYDRTHHYKPPNEFLSALHEGPRPPSPEYFDRLGKLGLD